MKHLYVHIPFCRSRCGYCDFASEPLGPHLRAGRVGPYLDALRVELEVRGASLELPVETIYLGGGTPTSLPRPALLDFIAGLSALQRSGAEEAVADANRSVDPEFTVEANPGTVDLPLLAALSEAGVTRLSLGIQSFSPALRAVLGRRVTQEEVDTSLGAIAAAGWREWNIDLVFGIPGQTWSDASGDIDAAVAAGPTHISLYDLTYTPEFASHVARTVGPAARGLADSFTEENLARTVSRLEEAGYRRYEVSNFARPEHECRHNLAYWRGEDYLGVGASAVSTVAGERRTNPPGVMSYLAGDPPEIEELAPFTQVWERAMLGLRTTEGVVEDDVRTALDPARLELLLEQGCLQRRCGKLRLNPGFMDVSNSVLAALLQTPDGS
jgi:oxygen-independent coproporphyrinogen-3 oxidase